MIPFQVPTAFCVARMEMACCCLGVTATRTLAQIESVARLRPVCVSDYGEFTEYIARFNPAQTPTSARVSVEQVKSSDVKLAATFYAPTLPLRSLLATTLAFACVSNDNQVSKFAA